MDLQMDNGVAVDERPIARPLTDNPQQSGDAEGGIEEDAEDDGDESSVALEDEAEETEETTSEEDEDDDDDFADDERDPFAHAAKPALAEVQDETEPSVEREPVVIDGPVYARVADCLRGAIAAVDADLAHARDLAGREAFYTGFVAVLEGKRRRYVAALERVLPQAALTEREPAVVDPVDVEPVVPA